MLTLIAPGDLEAPREAKEVLDCIEMAVQARPVAWFALGDADDQTARPLDWRAGAATLIVCRSHNRVDAPRRSLFHLDGWNVERLEILTLVGLKRVEPRHAGFHLLGGEGFCSHGACSTSSA